MPLLWVIPLSLYLLSFILCFRDRSSYRRKPYFLALALSTFFFGGDFFSGSQVHVLSNVVSCLASIFVCCMVCHGEVYRVRPESKNLTAFYLWIAFGSALGSLFAALGAPLLFRSYMEVPLGLAVLLIVHIFVLTTSGESLFPQFPKNSPLSERSFTWMLASYGLLWFFSHSDAKTVIFRQRNFYGTLVVGEFIDAADPGLSYRSLINGRILHGSAYLSPEKEQLPTSYYGRNSPLAAIFEMKREQPNLRLGVVGLGTGASGAWARASDTVRYYEINPAVEQIANDYFPFLKKTPAKKDVILGDARISLERSQPEHFDVLIIDAFSSDAIPFHLLTVEAMKVYLRHLNDEGILTFHVSNRHLNLEPIALSLAFALGLHGGVMQGEKPVNSLDSSSTWVILSRSEKFFQSPLALSRLERLTPEMKEGPLWTDDFASTLAVLKLLNPKAAGEEKANPKDETRQDEKVQDILRFQEKLG